MLNSQFNELIKNNLLLLFFLNKEKKRISKITSGAIIFLFLPLLLLLFSFIHNTLFLKDQGHIGILDDSLFIFSIFLVPIQFIILNFVILKFISFLEELPSLTIGFNKSDLLNFILKYKTFIGKKRPGLFIIKILIIIFFLYSNIKALYFREGGWNSPENTFEFSVTILYLVFIFSILIEILIKFLLIIIAQIRLTSELSKNNLLNIKPLSLDKSGSLKSLSELSLSFTYIIIPFMLSAITHYMTWGTLTIGYFAGILLLSLSTIFLFFFPLGTVHNVMQKSKKKFLKEIDDNYILACDKLLSDIRFDKGNIKATKDYCEAIKQLYEKGKEMPIWPFDIKIMTKFFSIVFGPLILVILNFLVQKMLEKIF